MPKIQASWGVTVSTGTFTDVSKDRGAFTFKVTQSTNTFDVSNYGSSSIFRVNEFNKCVFYSEWPWREALTSSETLANIWQSIRHNITEEYATSGRKTSIWIPALRVTCRKVQKNGKPLSVIRTRCFQTGGGEIWLVDIYCHKRQQKGNAEDMPDAYYETRYFLGWKWWREVPVAEKGISHNLLHNVQQCACC